MVQEEQDEVLNKAVEVVVATKSKYKASSSSLSMRQKRNTCGLMLGMEVVRLRAGFGSLSTKPSVGGFSVWASKPSPKAQRDGDGIWVRVGTLKRRTHGEIPELSWRRREDAVRACPSDGEFNHLPLPPGMGV